jgi:uncharacterized protein (TIGR03083 family)
MTNTETIDRIAVIRGEAQRFADVLADTPPESRCPTCPDWNAADLLWHLTEVHTFWATVLGDDLRTDEQAESAEQHKPERPDSVAAMLPLRGRATEDLLAQLAALADDEPRWTWWEADQTVGFTRRMQTYEATMHRVDAELTAGVDVSPISPAVAAGAVDHCADVMWGWMPDWAVRESLAVAELVASDTGQRWLVDVGHWTGTGPQSGNAFDEPHGTRADPGATPTVTVTGTVQGLALWAWTRGGTVQIVGDDAGKAALGGLIDRGIP